MYVCAHGANPACEWRTDLIRGVLHVLWSRLLLVKRTREMPRRAMAVPFGVRSNVEMITGSWHHPCDTKNGPAYRPIPGRCEIIVS